VAALCSSPAQHFAAVLCGHAGPESVRILALAFVRLKRPLHFLSNFNSKVLNVAKNGSRFNRDVSL